MTIEQLLELPVEDISKMSDAQLDLHLMQFFPNTRPAGPVHVAQQHAEKLLANLSPEMRAKMEQLKAEQKPTFKFGQKK